MRKKTATRSSGSASTGSITLFIALASPVKTLEDPKLGDIVTRANSLNEMLVVDIDGSQVTCSWRILPGLQPIERAFHQAALVLLRRPGNREK